MSFQNILLPTDGSDTANAASEKAIDMASLNEATLHLLYNVEAIPTSWNAEVIQKVMKENREKGKEILAEVKQRAEEAGVSVETKVQSDIESHQAIIDYAKKHDIDLIVMGTHGRSGLDRLMLGSTTERVLRTSSVPVLAIPAAGNK